MNVSTKSWFTNFFTRAKDFSFYNYSSFDGTPHKVNNLERKFLVWTGKFKTSQDVPDFVSQGTMERCRNLMRIKISNYMMIATAIGCISMVFLGKQAAKKGESLGKINLEWHKQMEAEMENKKDK